MPLHAILFSGLGALAETDALHLQAVNAALTEAGDSELSLAEFAEMADPDLYGALSESHGTGMAERVAELFRERLSQIGLTPRPGVAEIMSAAQAQGVRMALISSYDRTTLAAAMEAFGTTLEPGHFAEIIAREQGGVTSGGHRRTLDLLAAQSADARAIAATPGRAAAARGAGLPVIAFPSQAYRDTPFADVSTLTDTLSLADLGLVQPV